MSTFEDAVEAMNTAGHGRGLATPQEVHRSQRMLRAALPVIAQAVRAESESEERFLPGEVTGEWHDVADFIEGLAGGES